MMTHDFGEEELKVQMVNVRGSIYNSRSGSGMGGGVGGQNLRKSGIIVKIAAQQPSFHFNNQKQSTNCMKISYHKYNLLLFSACGSFH